jgi:starch phosphorylase
VPEHFRFYRSRWILDEYGLPTANFREAVFNLNGGVLREMKQLAKNELREYLPQREDQYGQGIEIPGDAKIAVWTKRIADYKRPSMLFDDPDKLAGILADGNVHLILSGKVHPDDDAMKWKLLDILRRIDAHAILRARAHFVQDYDERLAKALVPAIDICFNTPEVIREGERVNTEADGTFWKKAIAGNALLVSTRDGGVADIESESYFEIVGNNYEEELASLYANFERAVSEIDDPEVWGRRVKAALADYLPILSGARMIADYVNLMFPKAA